MRGEPVTEEEYMGIAGAVLAYDKDLQVTIRGLEQRIEALELKVKWMATILEAEK
jgi:hypothetical protein